jgi:hypothetical protein
VLTEEQLKKMPGLKSWLKMMLESDGTEAYFTNGGFIKDIQDLKQCLLGEEEVTKDV